MLRVVKEEKGRREWAEVLIAEKGTKQIFVFFLCGRTERREVEAGPLLSRRSGAANVKVVAGLAPVAVNAEVGPAVVLLKDLAGTTEEQIIVDQRRRK